MKTMVSESPSAPSVLVVDDEPAIRTTLRLILELEGYAVRLASSGAQALEQVEATPPRVVLLDVQMTGMDGWQTLPRLKALAPELPVIMVSGVRQLRSEAAAHHADGVVPKPFDVDGVLDAVARFIRSPAP
jgi:CheY-like chemotaxis protein